MRRSGDAWSGSDPGAEIAAAHVRRSHVRIDSRCPGTDNTSPYVTAVDALSLADLLPRSSRRLEDDADPGRRRELLEPAQIVFVRRVERVADVEIETQGPRAHDSLRRHVEVEQRVPVGGEVVGIE